MDFINVGCNHYLTSIIDLQFNEEEIDMNRAERRKYSKKLGSKGDLCPKCKCNTEFVTNENSDVLCFVNNCLIKEKTGLPPSVYVKLKNT